MPERLWTILCKELEEHNDTITAHHIFGAITSKGLLSEKHVTKVDQLSIVTAFGGVLGETFTFNARFLDPRGEPYGPSGNPVNIILRRIPEIVVLDFQDVLFMEPGTFGIEIKLNDTPIYVMPFYVEEGREAG